MFRAIVRSIYWTGFVGALLVGGRAEAARFEYESGHFGGQRGMAVQYEDLVDDGEYAHWDEMPPGPVSEVFPMELYDPLIGQALLTGKRTASVTTFGSGIEVYNQGTVIAQASGDGSPLRPWWVGRPGIADAVENDGYLGHAHCGSSALDLSYRIVPGDNEEVGDPVWLTFDGTYSVNHHINDVGYGRETYIHGGEGDDAWGIEVAGGLSGPYPQPYTVFVRSQGSVRERPVVRAPGRDIDYSTRIFQGERVPARIGDTIVFKGGAAPGVTIDNLPVSIREYISAQVSSRVSCVVEEGDEFALDGPLVPTADMRIVDNGSEAVSPDNAFAPFDAEIGQWPDLVNQTSEIASYWIGGRGESRASGGVSEFNLDFTLEESTPYSLYLILDSSDNGTASFTLTGPDSIGFDKGPDDWWVTRMDEGQLGAGEYSLSIACQAGELGGSDDPWANWDFDLTFGEPEIVPDDHSDAAFYLGIETGDEPDDYNAIFDVGEGGRYEVVGMPERARTALELQNPGDDPVSLEAVIELEETMTLEFEYLFALPGKLEVVLGDEVIDTLASEASDIFVLYRNEFTLSDYGLAPGEHPLSLRISNPDDPDIYLDEILVTTAVPEPVTVGMLALGLGVALRRRRA